MKSRSCMKHFDIIKMKYCRLVFFIFCHSSTEVSVMLTFFMPGQGILSLYVSFWDKQSFIVM